MMRADDNTGITADSTEELTQVLAHADLRDPAACIELRRAVEDMEAKSVLATRGSMLGRRMSALALADAGSSKVADDLQALASKLRQLVPTAADDRPGGLLRRLFGPARKSVASPAEIAAQMRDAVASLANSAQVLRQNNVALDGYEADIADEARRVEAELAQVEAFQAALDAAVDVAAHDDASAETLGLVRRETVFPLDRLRQNLLSLLAVNQQAALSLGILRETNMALVGHVRMVSVAARMALETSEVVCRAQARASRGSEDAPADGADAFLDQPEMQESLGKLSQALEAFGAWRADALPKKEQSMDDLHGLAEKLSESS